MLFAWAPLSQKSICLIRRDGNQFSFKFMLRCGLRRNSRCFFHALLCFWGRREKWRNDAAAACLFKGNDLIKESFPSSTQKTVLFRERRRFPLLFDSDLRYFSCVNGWLAVTSAHLTLHSLAETRMKYANFCCRHLTTASRAQKKLLPSSPIETQKSNPTHKISCLKARAQ